MEKRTCYFTFDNAFEEICCTKCPIKNDVFMGSYDCHKCDNFVSETHLDGLEAIIICKN